MWGLDHKEGWLPKNWCFWTVVLLRVLWTARRSNQSILKEINPEYSLKGLLLKLKLQYFGYLMWRSDSLERILMLGKIEDKRRSWQQRMRWLDRITDSVEINLNKIWRIEEDRGVCLITVCVVFSKAWCLNKGILLLGFPGGSDYKESTCNLGDPDSFPGSRSCPGEANSNPLQ